MICDFFKSIFGGPADQPGFPPTKTADWPNALYTDFLVRALNEEAPDLLAFIPKDAKDYCSNFKACDRRQFYVMLVSALANFESSFIPNATYTEKFTDNDGKLVVSRGLLQISKESANGYGAGITNENELHDPETNLRVGVLIMRKWILKDGVIAGGGTDGWRGMARYWSPFRDAKKKEVIQSKVRRVCA